MQRRTLLAAVASGTAVGAAGCVARGRELAGDSDDDGSTSNTTSDADEYLEIGDSDSADEERATPHRVFLENAGEEDREVAIEIEIDGESAFDEERDLAASERLEFRLVEPADYRVSIATDDANGDLTLAGASTDCTESVTTITLRDGGISTEMESSSGDCPSEEGSSGGYGYEFESGKGECADGDRSERAEVDVEDGVVAIEGTVETPTPCHRLALAAIEEDPEGETLEIVVAVDEPATDLCVECLGAVPYRATVDYADDLPETVAVVHETADDRRTVDEIES